ncbi:hypothetical protein RRG08_031169 [Elysia crispata]|uniref:Uncharacterized protein n=1 Tax=Elysia crispata TaxID=231223 RepID=A0AAE0ZGA0_9GAST|nr:hypothetical protein RRG08_031169 [Elysia crispata]
MTDVTTCWRGIPQLPRLGHVNLAIVSHGVQHEVKRRALMVGEEILPKGGSGRWPVSAGVNRKDTASGHQTLVSKRGGLRLNKSHN